MHYTEFTIFDPEHKMLVHIHEGDGSNLTREDEAEGLVDYVCVDTYSIEGGELFEEDGGFLMLEENFDDHFKGDIKKIVEECTEFIFGKATETYYMLWNPAEEREEKKSA